MLLFTFTEDMDVETPCLKNTNPNLMWKWKSLTNNGLSLVGIVIGGNVDYSVSSAIPTLGEYNAIMDLTLKVKYSVACKGSPFSFSAVYNTPKQFNVND